MDNKQKLEFILKLERRAKIKKILVLLVIVMLAGGLMIFSQYKTSQEMEISTPKQ